MPLSHQSSGWDLTFIQYYQTIAEPVLNATIEELLKHPEYRFNWGYTSFLELFYSTGDQSRKDKLQKVLATKQLEVNLFIYFTKLMTCLDLSRRLDYE